MKSSECFVRENGAYTNGNGGCFFGITLTRGYFVANVLDTSAKTMGKGRIGFGVRPTCATATTRFHVYFL